MDLYRSYWYCRNCKHGEYPEDIKMGITSEHRMTKAMINEVVFYSQNQMSFEKAEEIIERIYDIKINRETIRNISEDIGNILFEQDTERAEKLINNIHNIEMNKTKDGTLYIMPDGAAVNTRIEDENGSTWRENKTVIAFSSDDMIIRNKGGNIIKHKEISPLIGSSEEFKKYALDAAVRSGYGKYKNVVVIADGAAWIRNMCDEIFPDAIQILDLFHLKENIHAYSKYIFPQNTKKAFEWAEMIIDKIENHNAIDEVLLDIPEIKNHPEGLVKLKTYIENNREKINYPEYRKCGFFVGSGAIESTNKTIVQQRLKRAGMRWSVSGAQALLILRAKDESKRWDEVKQIC